MTTFKNEFSWSKSRDDIFHKCQRQYYYHYYASWGGWQRNADERTRKIYVLKKLTNQHLWMGDKVHQAVRLVLEAYRKEMPIMPEDQMVERMLDNMRVDFRNSRDGLHWKNPQTCGLYEHEYQSELSDEEWKKIAKHVEDCIRNFYHSSVFEEIKAIPVDRWLAVEELANFHLSELKVYVSIDFAFRRDDGVTIYDWKSGSSVNYDQDLQMACYGWYAWQKWNVDPKSIRLVEVNLNNMDTVTYDVRGVNLEKIQKRIFNSVQDMQFLLEDIGNNQGSEARFALTEDDRFCNFCNFRKVCPKWKEEPISSEAEPTHNAQPKAKTDSIKTSS